MNSGHQLLTIFSIVLVSFLVLNFYNSNTQKVLQMHATKSVIVADGLAQSIIEEIQTKAFDEKTIHVPVWTTTSLTPPASLGKDNGENINTQFDDIDDYKNYTATFNIERVGVFNINVAVCYVDQMNPDVLSGSQTYSKLVTVNITNESLPDTLRFKHVISY